MSDGSYMGPSGPVQPDYLAAGNGRRMRAFRASTTGPNSSSASVETIRARSRASVRNDPWAFAAIDKSVTNGIGCGILAKTVNGSKAHKAKVKALYEAFMAACDADGATDGYGQQALVWREWDEAGEVFIRLRSRRETDDLPVPLQIQVIEAEQCPSHYWSTASNGNAIRRGIEFNGIGRRVAYWMYREHPGDRHGTVNGYELVRVPAEQIRHLFIPLRAGQIRGVPRSAASLVRMFKLDQLTNNVLERSAVANLFSLFFTRKAGGSDEFASGSLAAEVAPETDGEGFQFGGLEPGTGFELPEGYDVKFAEPPSAGTDLPEFLRTHLLAIAATHGVPYEVLTGDLRDVSDRALRLILNEFRRLIEQKQWLYMIPRICQPIREAFFDAAVLAGKLLLPGYADRRQEYVETLHVPHGWPYSHPVQDVDADIKAVRAGFKSRNGVVLKNGDDPEMIDAEQVEDNARADALKLKHDSDGRQAKSGAERQKPEED